MPVEFDDREALEDLLSEQVADKRPARRVNIWFRNAAKSDRLSIWLATTRSSLMTSASAC